MKGDLQIVDRNRKTLIMAARIVIVVFLLSAIPVTIGFNINKVRNDIQKYNELKLKSINGMTNVNEAFIEILNAKFLVEMVKTEERK